LGYFIGPLVGGFLLAKWGTPGLLLLTAFTLPVGLNASLRLRHANALNHSPSQPNSPTIPTAASRPATGIVATLLGLAAAQSWATQNIDAFLPKYLSDLGQSPDTYGLITALFMGGATAGNLIGGILADRIGKPKAIAIALALAVPPLFAIPQVGFAGLFLAVPLAGIFTGATHSIIVVLAQELVPSGMGLASGLILGLKFSSGAIGALLSGYLADFTGLQVVFYLSMGLSLMGALLALHLHLHEARQARQPVIAGD
jgi:FSR family fosmidomycin resistance protein-like MFS transporter